MKRRLTAIIVASIVALGMPVLAAERPVVGEQSGQRAETILEKISRLNAEMEKGPAAYTPAELKKLELKLREAQEILTALNQGG